jgi:hypothetical protein
VIHFSLKSVDNNILFPIRLIVAQLPFRTLLTPPFFVHVWLS